MAFSFVAGAGVYSAGTSGTTISATLAIDLLDGDLVVGCATWEDGASTTTIDDTDGANALTMLTGADDGTQYMRMGWLEVASDKSDTTFRMNSATSRAYRSLIVLQFRPTAAVSIDPNGYDGSAGSGTGTAAASGNLTTTGSDNLAVGFAKQYFGALTESSWLINSNAATRYGMPALMDSWYLTGQSGTFNAQVTYDTSSAWLCDIIGFRIGAGSGPSGTIIPAVMYNRRMRIG